MPTTVNGIGTTYYGKANRSVRQDTCHSCGRASMLESYDTRLWFVIIFIPIIPLGRKRITDSCPFCKRHFVAPLGQWEDARQMTNSGTKAEFLAQPTPENAERHHRGLLAFHQHVEADAFMKEAMSHFSTDAPLHAYFGAVKLQAGRLPEAEKLYTQALELNRDLPAAREGMALIKMNTGNLEEASELLEHLRTPGAAQLHDISFLENLGMAYQRRGKHAEALEQFEVLLRELPPLGEHTGFRKTVAASEKALRKTKTDSLLPERKFSWGRLWTEHRTACLVSLAVILGGAGSIMHNMHLAGHAPLHVVNGYHGTVRVQIDGGTEQPAIHGHTLLELPEGVHQVTMTGAVNETVQVDIRRGFFERWSNDNAWVLNPGGRAIVLEESVLYVPDGSIPPTSVLPMAFTGTRLFSRQDVDYVFTVPPTRQEIPSGQSYVERRRLRLHEGDIQDIIDYYVANKNPGLAMQFCEDSILGGTASDDIILAYGNLAVDESSRGRISRLLKAEAAKRPVQVTIHRVWQDLQLDLGKSAAEVVAEYDALSKAASEDAALVYLRGRMEPDPALQSSLLQKATEMPGAPGWSWYGRGMDHALAGDWKTAGPMFEKAVAMSTQNAPFLEMLLNAQRATGQWKPLLETLNARVRLNPTNMLANLSVIEAHMAQGDPKTAQAVSANYYMRLKTLPDTKDELEEFALLTADLLGNDEFVIQQTARAKPDSVHGQLRVQALVMTRSWNELESAIKTSPQQNDPLFHLAAALAAQMDGREAAAQVWLDRALALISSIDNGSHSLATALKSSSAPAPATLDLSGISIQRRGVVWAWLAVKHPSMKAVYAELARSFNLRGYFPSRLLSKAAAL